ncbi:hypothetical protein L0P02_00960, partial [Bifidobacterium longum]|nr:hypothetical protein [Bifidobacterium longum]
IIATGTGEDQSAQKLGHYLFVGRVWQCFSAVSDGLTCLAGERPVVDDEQARVAETLKKLHRGDMDIVAYEDEHKFDGDGDEPA